MATLSYKECLVIVVYAMISRSLTAREITYNNFEISLVVFMPNITTNHAITYTNNTEASEALVISLACVNNEINNLQLVFRRNENTNGGHCARRSWPRPWKLRLRIVAFPKRIGPRILSLESVDYFGTSEHY